MPLVTSLEGEVRDLSEVETTPSTYASLTRDLGDSHAYSLAPGEEDFDGAARDSSSTSAEETKTLLLVLGSISSILSESLAAARPGPSRKEIGVATKRAYQQQLGEAKQTETKP